MQPNVNSPLKAYIRRARIERSVAVGDMIASGLVAAWRPLAALAASLHRNTHSGIKESPCN